MKELDVVSQLQYTATRCQGSRFPAIKCSATFRHRHPQPLQWIVTLYSMKLQHTDHDLPWDYNCWDLLCARRGHFSMFLVSVGTLVLSYWVCIPVSTFTCHPASSSLYKSVGMLLSTAILAKPISPTQSTLVLLTRSSDHPRSWPYDIWFLD